MHSFKLIGFAVTIALFTSCNENMSDKNSIYMKIGNLTDKYDLVKLMDKMWMSNINKDSILNKKLTAQFEERLSKINTEIEAMNVKNVPVNITQLENSEYYKVTEALMLSYDTNHAVHGKYTFKLSYILGPIFFNNKNLRVEFVNKKNEVLCFKYLNIASGTSIEVTVDSFIYFREFDHINIL